MWFMLRYSEAIQQSYLNVLGESACISYYETDHQFSAMRKAKKKNKKEIGACMSHSAFVQNDAMMLQTGSNYEAQVSGLESKTIATVLLWAENCKKWVLALRKGIETLDICAIETYIFNRNQQFGNPGSVLKGFSAIFSNAIKSLATFGMDYLVVNKYFCHHCGVIFACGYWLAYHFLYFILQYGLLAPYVFGAKPLKG